MEVGILSNKKFLILIILAIFAVGMFIGSVSAHTISLEPEFDKHVNKTIGEYTVDAIKWKGQSAGGFGVSLYKNGQLMDRDSYQSRAYFCMNGEWKWSNWDDGEDDAMYHKYPVSDGVEIKEIEVKF